MGSSSRKKGSKKRSREEEEEDDDSSSTSSGTSSGTSTDTSGDDSRGRRDKKRRKEDGGGKSKRKHKKESRKKDKKKHKHKHKHHRSSREDDEDGDRSHKSKAKAHAAAASSAGLGDLSRLAETEEERAARKAAKEAKKIAAHFGYTAHSNPFGDANLHQQFIWKAKEKQQAAKSGGGAGKNKAEEAERRLELIREIEKVRQRREDREKELEEMDRLKAEEARLREASMYEDWERKEEEFHLEQARIRSKIRLIEGREKPIDALAKNLLLFGQGADGDAGEEGRGGIIKYRGKSRLDMSHLEAELREPYLIFENLSVEELQDLQHDIREYQHLESQGPNKEFWGALALVCKDELAKAGALPGKDALTGGGVHAAAAEELEGMFGGKSVLALEKMRGEIQARLDKGEETGLDVDYWENVLAELQVYRARAFLREQHQGMLLQQLQRLEERKRQLARDKAARRKEGGSEDEEEEEDEEEGSPRQEAPAPEPENTGYDDSTAALALVTAERGKGLGRDEGVVGKGDEVELGDKTYWWHDRYRPRKPRYFNRVKTGWDWNMYNRTHYDRDNPPPKTVQGYKFNIFYPDLIDKTKTPQFFIEPCEDPEFCIIRFHAGPPYEDVAFKIINREWERGHRRGFKCLFERGILSLYFNFKRLLYRR